MEITPWAEAEDFYEYLEIIFIEKKISTTFKVFLENLMKKHEEEFYSRAKKEMLRGFILTYGYTLGKNCFLEITLEKQLQLETAVTSLKYEENGYFSEQPLR